MKVIDDSLWILTNELQNFITGTSLVNDVKYRVLVGSVSNLIHETGCDLRSGDHSIHELANSKLNYDSERFPTETRPLYLIPKIPTVTYTRMPLFEDQTSPLSFNFVPGTRSWQKVFQVPQWKTTFPNV